MSKYLYLIRHASANEADSDQKDKDRTLTAVGRRDAHYLATHLSSSNVQPDMILTSSATRAKETAEIIAEILDHGVDKLKVDDELYNAPIRILLSAVNAIDSSVESVFLIGHNPAITFLADYLTAEDIGGMSPCTLVLIEFEVDTWEEVSANTGQIKITKSPDR